MVAAAKWSTLRQYIAAHRCEVNAAFTLSGDTAFFVGDTDDRAEPRDFCLDCGHPVPCNVDHSVDEPHGAISRTSPDGSVTVTVPCDEAKGELP